MRLHAPVLQRSEFIRMFLRLRRGAFAGSRVAPVQQQVQGRDADVGRQQFPPRVLAFLFTLRQRMLLQIDRLLQAIHELLEIAQDFRAAVTARAQRPALLGFKRIPLQLLQLVTRQLAQAQGVCEHLARRVAPALRQLQGQPHASQFRHDRHSITLAPR